MNKYDIERTNAESKWDKAMLQLTGWVLALAVIGVIVTAVLAIIKTAAYTAMIVGGICLVVALLAMWGYHSTKWRVQKAVYEYDVKNMRKQLDEKEAKNDNK